MAERERWRREKLSLLIHSLNGYSTSLGQASPGNRNTILVSHKDGKDPSTWVIFLTSQGALVEN